MSRRRSGLLRASQPSLCSICRAAVEGEGLTFTEGPRDRPVGLYCRARCRDAGQALAALAELQAFTPRSKMKQRNEIAEGLLALWRRGIGPDPLLVIAAAERASAPRPALVR